MAALPARWLHVRRPDIHLDLIQKEVLFKILSAETEVKVCSCDLRQSGNCETHRRQSAASGLQFIEQLGINHQINASKSAVNPSFFSSELQFILELLTIMMTAQYRPTAGPEPESQSGNADCSLTSGEKTNAVLAETPSEQRAF